jgi:hypothetical protein
VPLSTSSQRSSQQQGLPVLKNSLIESVKLVCCEKGWSVLFGLRDAGSLNAQNRQRALISHRKKVQSRLYPEQKNE